MEDLSLGSELARDGARDGTSRRRFLQGVAGVAGAVAAAGTALPHAAAAPQAAASPAAGPGRLHNVQIGLFVEGAFAGFLESVAGGMPVADVVVEPGEGAYARKRLGSKKYSNIVLKKGVGGGQPVYEWIQAGVGATRSGEIVVTNKRGDTRVQKFVNALVTELSFPACDAASKAPALMTVSLAPESTQLKQAPRELPPRDTTAKKALVSGFTLAIDGVDCSRVNKVEAFTIKQTAVVDDVGPHARFDVSDLRISLAESSSGTWSDWFDDFVVRGNASDHHERSGRLSFDALDGTEVFAVDLQGLGIFELTPDPYDVNDDGVRHVTAALYAEEIQIAPLDG